MNLQALKSELDSDPLGLGYAAMSDVEAADSLNAPTREPNRDSISGGELAAAIDFAEYAALGTAIHRQYLQLLTAAPELPVKGPLRSTLAGFFPQNSATRQNIAALLKQTGSRAQELGLGVVTPSHVADARRL